MPARECWRRFRIGRKGDIAAGPRTAPGASEIGTRNRYITIQHRNCRGGHNHSNAAGTRSTRLPAREFRYRILADTIPKFELPAELIGRLETAD